MIFPAKVNQLTKYICTLKPNVMQLIDQSIFECLFGISDDISDTSTETESDISEEYSDVNSDDTGLEDTVLGAVAETSVPDMDEDVVPDTVLKNIKCYSGIDNKFIDIDAIDVSQGVIKFAAMLKSELGCIIDKDLFRVAESNIRAVIYDKIHVVVNDHNFIVSQTDNVEKKYKNFVFMLRDMIRDPNICNKKYLHNIVKEYRMTFSDLISPDITRAIANVLNIHHHVLINVFSI